MERWEPPVTPAPSATPKARSPLSLIKGQDAVPETIEIIVPRMAIGFMLLLPSSGRVPVLWLSGAGPFLVVVLLGMGTLQSRLGTRLSRSAWLIDGVVLGILTPILLVNAFAATGSGPLRRAEESVYLQTIVAATFVLIGLILIGSRLRGRQAYSWGILLLPAALTTVGLMSAYADYKTTSIVLALSIAWFVATAITIVAQVVSGGFAVIFPLIGYVLYTLASVVVTGSGLSFGGRPAPVSVVHPVLIVVVGLSLLAPLVPTGDGIIATTLPGGRRNGRSSRRGRPRPRRPQRTMGSAADLVELDDLEEFRT